RRGGSATRVALERGDEPDHAARRDRVEEALRVVEQVEDAQRADDERHRREESEQGAVRDLLGETETVVGEELLESPLQRREPLAAAEAPRVRGCASVRPRFSRGRQGRTDRPGPSSYPRARA